MTDSHDGFCDLSGIGDMFKSCVAHMKVRACVFAPFSGLLHAYKVDGTNSKPYMHAYVLFIQLLGRSSLAGTTIFCECAPKRLGGPPPVR